MKTQVCITVDVEFDVAGTFSDPENKRPVGTDSVRCSVNGEEAGLGFVLTTLEKHGLRGVFFIETMNTCYFGYEPMGDIAREIQARGHDVELHLHPVWSVFGREDWKAMAERREIQAPTHDSLAALSAQETAEHIEHGLNCFREWGLRSPIALRAGNLSVERAAYRAMARLGVPLASNLGFGLYRPRDASLHLYAGRHFVEGVMEVPVTSFRDVKLGSYERWQILTILGVSFAEMRSLLRSAARVELSPVVFLTHASEFFHRNGGIGATANPLSQKRLAELCRFLSENDDHFEVTTFRAQRAEWTSGRETGNEVLSVPAWRTAQRLIANRIPHPS
jgi:hypothetical protein